MSAKTDSEPTLAAYGAGEPETPDPQPEPETEEDTSDDTAETSVGDFEGQDIEVDYDQIRKQYHVCGRDYGNAAAELGQDPAEVLDALAENGHVHVRHLDLEGLARLFEACDRDAAAVAQSATEDRFAVETALVRAGVVPVVEMHADSLRAMYDDYEADYGRIAEELGVSKRDLFEALIGIGLVEQGAEFYIKLLWPHEVGLSPLNCANCQEPEIMEYDCPACGHGGASE